MYKFSAVRRNHSIYGIHSTTDVGGGLLSSHTERVSAVAAAGADAAARFGETIPQNCEGGNTT